MIFLFFLFYFFLKLWTFPKSSNFIWYVSLIHILHFLLFIYLFVYFSYSFWKLALVSPFITWLVVSSLSSLLITNPMLLILWLSFLSFLQSLIELLYLTIKGVYNFTTNRLTNLISYFHLFILSLIIFIIFSLIFLLSQLYYLLIFGHFYWLEHIRFYLMHLSRKYYSFIKVIISWLKFISS